MDKAYLGDGVYIKYTGDEFLLTTEDGMAVTNIIYLEPSVMEALIHYIEQLKKESLENARPGL